MSGPVELSIVIPALDEAENLECILPEIHAAATRSCAGHEVLVVDEHANEDTRAVVARHGVRLVVPSTGGYGRALRAGWGEAAGRFVVTMDADQSHPATFIEDLWRSRETADVVIASRYVDGGSAEMPRSRWILSRLLNRVFSRALSLGIADVSSGFRLYRADVLRGMRVSMDGFDLLEEVLVRAIMEGYAVREVPFDYQPRRYGTSRARVVALGIAYLRALRGLWKVRNSIESADYDARAIDSAILPQRYWQRRRFRHVVDAVPDGLPCLDVGSGSSRILSALPRGSIALDVLLRKARYNKRSYNLDVMCGSGLSLPFRDHAFSSVLCSQVIEHVPGEAILDELDRVLAPGGVLVLGTPDYGRWQWRVIERLYERLMPNAYADEHITHYTMQSLTDRFVADGSYRLERHHYILWSELILVLRKAGSDGEGAGGLG